MENVEKQQQQEVDFKRVNIRISPEVYNYFRNKSDMTKISASAMMFLVLEEYVKKMNG